jgi:hypothetical protein
MVVVTITEEGKNVLKTLENSQIMDENSMPGQALTLEEAELLGQLLDKFREGFDV